jgi:hypothetical protein
MYASTSDVVRLGFCTKALSASAILVEAAIERVLGELGGDEADLRFIVAAGSQSSLIECE